MIKEIGQPSWVVKKQPANHCLKPCGLSIGRGVSTPGATSCSVAATTHEILLFVGEPGLQPLESCCLGISPDLRHHSAVQILGPSCLPAMTQTLMQFPDGISKPGELQRSEIGRTGR